MTIILHAEHMEFWVLVSLKDTDGLNMVSVSKDKDRCTIGEPSLLDPPRVRLDARGSVH